MSATLEKFVPPRWMTDPHIAAMFARTAATVSKELQALAADPDAFPEDDEDGDDNAADGDACDEPEMEKAVEED